MKRLLSASLQMVAILIAFFALSGTAQSAAPGTPLSFTARLLDGTKYVYLEWKSNQENGAGKADGFKIFMATAKTDDINLFKEAAIAKDGNYYKFRDLSSGEYSFYVIAYNADGESNRTDFRNVTVPGSNNDLYIKFVSDPIKTGTPGKEYIYKSVAVSSISSSTISYKLDGNAPDGMTIDEKTGVVTWTPSRDGVYKYTIIAYIADRSDIKAASQTIEVKVGAGGQDNTLKFASEPAREASAGKEFTYQPKVTSSDPNIQVLFKLDYSPEGMTIDEKTGLLTWTPEKDGEYKVMLTAYVPGTNIKTTQTFVIVVGKGNNGGDKSAVKFITKPTEYACIGKEFIYDAEAVSSLASLLPMSYKITVGIDGMTIDEKTGLLKWTPSRTGEYKVSIWAGLGNDPATSATQTFSLRVKENCDIPQAPCAKVFGKIVDEAGNVVNYGYVKAVRLDKSNGEASLVGKINQGTYSLGVVEGSYALYVSGEEFTSEWYMDAESVDKATPVVITCNTETQADFVVVRREKAKNVVVEGSVKNANGEPVYSTIEFIVKDINGADLKEFMGKYVTKTDEKGNFRIEIQQNLIVIAHAIPKGTDKYLDQYYKGVTNPEEATRLTLSANQAIDFVLTDRPIYQNGFSGKVRDSANLGVVSRVLAYRFVAANGKEPSKYEARTVETNANGEFSISNLIPGDYILFGIPKEKQGFAPGYYKSGDFASVKWQEATVISVGDVMIQQVFEIILRPSNGRKGAAHLGGKVTRKGGIMKGESPLEDTPVAGAMMVTLDANGNISDYLFSDDQGKFDFTELTQGDVVLVADKPGYVASSSTIGVDYAAKASVLTSVLMVAQNSSSSVEEGFTDNSGVTVFPNPASNTMTLSLETTAGIATVSIVSTLGSEVTNFQTTTYQGMNQLSFDCSNLPTGMYLVRIQTGIITRTVSMRIVR
ncbi:MAG: putative Ig domain-containing protein [Ignavibacteria bacterium]|nr:putative Ig domain-containing protein [Ignavibacteria bacterium]